MNKQEAISEWNAYKNMRWTSNSIIDIQEEWESFIFQLYTEKTKKKSENLSKVYSYLSEHHKEELAEKKSFYLKKVLDREELYEKEKEELKEKLVSFAKTYEPPFSKEKILLKTSRASHYHSQGFGASKYAKAQLQDDFTVLNILGYQPTINIVETHRGNEAITYNDYGLYAHLSEFDYDMIKMGDNFISVLNWAVICWRNHTNPKVYFPFLPDDYYEKSMKLAYDNSYVITKENMGKE